MCEKMLVPPVPPPYPTNARKRGAQETRRLVCHHQVTDAHEEGIGAGSKCPRAGTRPTSIRIKNSPMPTSTPFLIHITRLLCTHRTQVCFAFSRASGASAVRVRSLASERLTRTPKGERVLCCPKQRRTRGKAHETTQACRNTYHPLLQISLLDSGYGRWTPAHRLRNSEAPANA